MPNDVKRDTRLTFSQVRLMTFATFAANYPELSNDTNILCMTPQQDQRQPDQGQTDQSQPPEAQQET